MAAKPSLGDRINTTYNGNEHLLIFSCQPNLPTPSFDLVIKTKPPDINIQNTQRKPLQWEHATSTRRRNSLTSCSIYTSNKNIIFSTNDNQDIVHTLYNYPSCLPHSNYNITNLPELKTYRVLSGIYRSTEVS